MLYYIPKHVPHALANLHAQPDNLLSKDDLKE